MTGQWIPGIDPNTGDMSDDLSLAIWREDEPWPNEEPPESDAEEKK